MAKVVVVDQEPLPEISQKYEKLLKTASFECKDRPYIASPFMPIATTLSIPLERRPPSSPKLPRKNAVFAAGAKPDDALLSGDERRSPTTTDEDSSSDGDESSISIKGSFSSLSSREWITIVMLAIANLCSTVAFSCIAPFYPDEAKKKSMTESQTGIVFGVFELVMFVMAPVFGKYMTVIGSKNMFTLGLAITGITAILFGFLNYLPSGNIFFLASVLIRILEAIGDAAFVTSAFAISAKCFPGNIAVVVGIMETFAGLGYTAGPLIGGFLYEFGGFQVPFLVLGAILLLATALGWWLIENFRDDKMGSSKGMVAMLHIPVVWIMVYAVVVCAISLSFLDPTLSAHLQSFNLSPTMIGLMFLLCGGIYTLTAPLWGFLIDRYQCATAVMFFGSSATVISMALIGPSPLLPLSKNLVMIGISLALLGVAAGALYIPTFQSCLDAVKDHGYDDSFRTYGCVSGVFQSAFALGGFMVPLLAGSWLKRSGLRGLQQLSGLSILCFSLQSRSSSVLVTKSYLIEIPRSCPVYIANFQFMFKQDSVEL
ncbi:hypothetical protein KIN20_000698 [Parelaphostrongylus tenuis]|uniref:Major facilitator superfamily (MFS) profile domain-containing protein n=1 Tax=Parelaphostrongylus tenuis TaxID=148309 RepID=A0AAD5QBQ6_PARTN|nr:hypothetical protein KIN20_000698 [Parelaphostrongylus tenuis]